MALCLIRCIPKVKKTDVLWVKDYRQVWSSSLTTAPTGCWQPPQGWVPVISGLSLWLVIHCTLLCNCALFFTGGDCSVTNWGNNRVSGCGEVNSVLWKKCPAHHKEENSSEMPPWKPWSGRRRKTLSGSVNVLARSVDSAPCVRKFQTLKPWDDQTEVWHLTAVFVSEMCTAPPHCWPCHTHQLRYFLSVVAAV